MLFFFLFVFLSILDIKQYCFQQSPVKVNVGIMLQDWGGTHLPNLFLHRLNIFPAIAYLFNFQILSLSLFREMSQCDFSVVDRAMKPESKELLFLKFGRMFYPNEVKIYGAIIQLHSAKCNTA